MNDLFKDYAQTANHLNQLNQWNQKKVQFVQFHAGPRHLTNAAKATVSMLGELPSWSLHSQPRGHAPGIRWMEVLCWFWQHLHSPVSSFKDGSCLKYQGLFIRILIANILCIHFHLKISEMSWTFTSHFFKCLFSSDVSPPIGWKHFSCAHDNHGRHVNSSDAKVSKWPTTTKPRRERVMVTFKRRGSPKKPTFPVVLARTVETRIKSFTVSVQIKLEKSVEFHKKWNDICEQLILDRSWV